MGIFSGLFPAGLSSPIPGISSVEEGRLEILVCGSRVGGRGGPDFFGGGNIVDLAIATEGGYLRTGRADTWEIGGGGADTWELGGGWADIWELGGGEADTWELGGGGADT